MSRNNPFPVLNFIADGTIVLAAIVFTGCFITVIYLAVNGKREYGILIACVAIPVSLGLNIFGEIIGVLLSIERNGRQLVEQNQQAQLTHHHPVTEEAESRNITIACPSCGTGFSTETGILGKTVRCGKCGLKFTANDQPF